MFSDTIRKFHERFPGSQNVTLWWLYEMIHARVRFTQPCRPTQNSVRNKSMRHVERDNQPTVLIESVGAK